MLLLQGEQMPGRVVSNAGSCTQFPAAPAETVGWTGEKEQFNSRSSAWSSSLEGKIFLLKILHGFEGPGLPKGKSYQ